MAGAYTIAGGSLLTSGKSDQLRIKPDAGAEVVTLQGQMTCDGIRGSTIRITVGLVPPDGGGADTAPTVKISW